jgi:hypothetical protein
MRAVGRDYVSLDASGDNEADFARMQAIGEAIAVALGARASYRVRRVDSPRKIEEAMRNPATVLAVSGGRLPLLLVNITDLEGNIDPHEIAALAARLGLRSVAVEDDAGGA